MSPTPNAPLTWQKSIGVIVLAAIVYGAQQMGCITADDGTNVPSAPSSSASTSTEKTAGASQGADHIRDAFKDGTSGFMVDATGVVDRVLPDDNDGARHQRFIVRMTNDHTILIAHNIDLADRVPLRQGDTVKFRGQYEWNDRGGVIHWTHHDPRGRHDEGYIEYDGKVYR